jgi:beta-glucosidase
MTRHVVRDWAIGGAVVGWLASALLIGRAAPTARSADPLYLDADQPFEARAADLVARMTTEEKISELTHESAAIPRLGIPAYNWWNECLHGVARTGVATVFPQAIGMAASFDPELLFEVATAISDEARAKHHQFAQRGLRTFYQGLTFWSPNINIFRDPRWGRGQETYGEDPYLTGRMGVAFVKGLQGDDPKYYKLIATAKHYAVHSGPEPERHRFDARVSDRDLYETYLPAFQALVAEGGVASIMGAYNRVNGEPASASPRLLQEILRRDWGFGGYVVSDCGAIDDIHARHQVVPTPQAAAALGIRMGCDLECGTVYRRLGEARTEGLLSEAELDVAVKRVMLARLRLGMFDPPERVRYASIPTSVIDSPDHEQLARRMARESIVLLKNDGVLPLRKDLRQIAVIGPNADEIMTLLGNYYGTPARPVTALSGIRHAVGRRTKVVYARGADLVEGRADLRAAPVIAPEFLRPGPGSTEHGLKAEYFRGRELEGEPVVTRIDPKVDFLWDRRSPTDEAVARGELPLERLLPPDNYSARWTGQLLPPVSGRYDLIVTANDAFRLFLDGKLLLEEWSLNQGSRVKSGAFDLEAGRAYGLRLEYFEGTRDADVRLAWTLPGAQDPFEEAIQASRASDVVVFVGGLTADVEGEEMANPTTGFRGGDRTDIAFPATQERLLAALHATGKPVVLVLLTGSALAVEWARDHLPAIVLGWYPGEQGGNALADVLFGDVSPAGRLPVTFYRSTGQLPPFEDYAMKERTYRYFSGEPLYPFGHGLSYTRFEYAGLQLDRTRVRPDQDLEVSLQVRNAGARDGDEVVQLYVHQVTSSEPMPLKQLRGFARIRLKRGETRRAAFHLKPAVDFAHYDAARRAFAVDPGEFEIQVGASSADIRLRGRVRVE